MSYNRIEFEYLFLKGQGIRILRHIPITKKYAKTRPYGGNPVLSTEDGRSILKKLIESNRPFMAGRFGTTEGAALYSYWKSKIVGGGYTSTKTECHVQ